MQRRASGRPASAIEADMDRLFARRVVVYGQVSLGDSTEAVLNTVLKVRMKCDRGEVERCMFLCIAPSSNDVLLPVDELSRMYHLRT